MKQEDIGKLLNVELAAISKYETGRVQLKEDYIKLLSNYFDVSSDYLLGRSDIRHAMTDKEFTKSLLTSDFINLMNLTEEQKKTLNILVEGFKKENENNIKKENSK